MGKAFESIMRGLREIEEHQGGKITLRTTVLSIEPAPRYDAKDVKRFRAKLKLSQATFAQLLGVSKKTVEAWEAGRNEPNGSACRLIEMIEKDTNILAREGILVMS